MSFELTTQNSKPRDIVVAVRVIVVVVVVVFSIIITLCNSVPRSNTVTISVYTRRRAVDQRCRVTVRIGSGVLRWQYGR